MNKYNAKRIKIDGYFFASEKEGQRYRDLKLMNYNGNITDLIIHPKFELQEGFVDVEGKKIQKITYTADFQYIENGKTIVIDVKGGKATQTEAFKIKWKIVKYNYPTIYFRVEE